ncbi:MAG: hypothetical protein IPP72_10675 [Chitinophagaceae bacterium]|nr:hypothetical protein [Chitinophagaceae bacterium]
MITKIIFLLTLLTYGIIVSQSFMYILALKQVQLNLEANPYIELRKLIDAGMRSNFKYVIYAALLLNLTLMICRVKEPGSLLFITASIAFVTLVADTLLTVKGNLPINDIINTWAPDNYPSNWSEYRKKWFDVFQYRQIANITGFVSLLTGAVFGSK